MNIEEKLILCCLQAFCGDNSKNREIEALLKACPIDWGKIKEIVAYHEIMPFIYTALKEYPDIIPHDFMEYLKNTFYCTFMRNKFLQEEFIKILEHFKKAELILVPLKGMALMHDIYADYPARTMTDIDILIKEESFRKAEYLFYELGYYKDLAGLNEKYWRKNQCHFTFYKSNPDEYSTFIELHWAIDFKRHNRLILPLMWDRLSEVDIVNGDKIKLLSPEDTIVSIALHQRRFGKTLCLKYVVDIALILKRYANTFDWDYVVREAKKGKIAASLFFILLQLDIFMGLKVPYSVTDRLMISYWKIKLMNRFIKINMFSQGDLHIMYLKSHFLLYDNMLEPIEYIVNIPKEQFAKFYGLVPYKRMTDILYNSRFFYIPLEIGRRIVCGDKRCKTTKNIFI